MLGWMNPKLESRYPGEIINNHIYADDTTLMAESEEELKSLLMKVKEENEKACLKLNIKNTNIMAPDLIREKWKQGQIFSSWAPKSLWMMTAAMKLEDTCFLEGMLWQT